jgi:UDP-glucose 4-epimerase
MILVTGGAGYIGSHTCVELLEAGYELLVLDNFSNSKPESLNRVEKITGKTIRLIEGDVRNRDLLHDILSSNKIDGVIHFAGLKAVGESVQKPLMYYDNNVSGSIVLAEVIAEFGVHVLVFSSSATVYGNPESLPISENAPVGKTTNPYGGSKLMVEQIYTDLAKSSSAWKIALLRYFNPVGAHTSGTIGEDPSDIPNNLMPYISQVAVGRREKLTVFGDDYETVDGTGVRDYIHVVDLAKGHVKALAWLQNQTGAHIFNLGTGRGYSVLEMVKAFEIASNCAVHYQISPRRAGDVAEVYADCSKAEKEFGWKAERDINVMCQDAWRWQKNNPFGYTE